MTEEAEKRESKQAKADEGLEARDGAQPAAGLKVVLAKEEAADPAAKVQSFEAKIDDADETEKEHLLEKAGLPAQTGPARCDQPEQSAQGALQTQPSQEFLEAGPAWSALRIERRPPAGQNRD